jgi:hypothetical protein
MWGFDGGNGTIYDISGRWSGATGFGRSAPGSNKKIVKESQKIQHMICPYWSV